MIKHFTSLRVTPDVAFDLPRLKTYLAREARVAPAEVTDVVVTRRSIDAR